MGLMFDCLHCVKAGIRSEDSRMVRIPVAFTNPVDGGAPFGPESRPNGVPIPRVLWTRVGDTFETLSLSPSIDASKTHEGGWHGHVRGGWVEV